MKKEILKKKNRHKLSICFFMLFITANIFASIKVVLRYDDPMLRANAINDSLFTMLQELHIPFTIAVIPCSGDEEKLVCDTSWKYLPILKNGITNKSIEVALHGLNHKESNNVKKGGEFGNVAYEEQYRRIAKGKKMLDSVLNCNIITFIPPYNSYDTNTLNVLENCGFKAFSADMFGTVENNNIQYYPCTVHSPLELLSTINTNRERSGLIILMYHHYDFNEKFTIGNFMEILQIVLNEYPQVEFVTFSDLVELYEVSDKARISANRQSNLLYKRMKLGGILYPTKYVQSTRIVNGFLHSVFSFFISVFFYLLLFGKKRPKWTNLLSILFMSIFAFFVVFYELQTPMKSILLIVSFSFLNIFVVWLIEKILIKRQ